MVSTNTNINDTDYARRTRDLIQLVHDLQDLGAGDDLELPRIAVIGNQSAGKSSLVEAISGITVPRDSGTCTRCPMECRMKSSSSPWECQIFLRKEVQDNGRPVSGVGREEKFGPAIADKTLLEDMIKRAQLAILNPSIQPHRFVNFDLTTLSQGTAPLGSSRQLGFSPNVVCLDISGPGVTDLAFIDLPGIISNGKKEDIEAIENMVRNHIKGQTLILTTINMSDDIENQGAARLAREIDPPGERTIGVLTKPDRVQSGEHEKWAKVLSGDTHQLRHGYYITKQRKPEELRDNISFEEARSREHQFFQTEAPWKNLTSMHSRMGTPNLTAALSKLLGKVIQDALPRLREQSKALYESAKKEFDEFPPSPSENPAAELLRLVTDFSYDVSQLIRGSEEYEQLLQRCRPAYADFKRKIRLTAPDYRPFIDEKDEKSHYSGAVGESMLVIEDQDELKISNKPTYLLEITKIIETSLTRELPFNVPFRAKVTLIKRFFVEWAEYSAQCFGTVNMATLGELVKLVDARFGHAKLSGLHDRVLELIDEQVERTKLETHERIRQTLDLDKWPFTKNEHYFASYRVTYLNKYKKARSGRALDVRYTSQAISTLALLGFTGLTPDDLWRLKEDAGKYEDELIVMAEVTAYFHVAYKRIIDDIPRVIDQSFLWAIERSIRGALVDGLELATEDSMEKARKYLAESSETTQRRDWLKNRMEQLRKIKRKLSSFVI